MSFTIYPIHLGTPLEAESELILLDAGEAGDPGACRRLVYPSAVSTALAPIVYQIGSEGRCFNPTRTFNFDTEPMTHPISRTQRTLGGTRVVRFTELAADVVVTEVWEATPGASMPISFFRRLYEYLLNPPAISLSVANYIVWEPRDRTDRTWNVELVSITVGGGADAQRFDMSEIRDPGGLSDGGTIANAIDTLQPITGGLIDREVRLAMKIISEVLT